YGVAIGADGKIFVAGTTTPPGFGSAFAVVKYTSDGTLDSGFGVGGKVVTGINLNSTNGNGIVMRPDGRIVVVGSTHNNIGVVNYDFALGGYQPNNNVIVDNVPPTITLSGDVGPG